MDTVVGINLSNTKLCKLSRVPPPFVSGPRVCGWNQRRYLTVLQLRAVLGQHGVEELVLLRGLDHAAPAQDEGSRQVRL